MTKLSSYLLAMLAFSVITFTGCDDDEDPIINEVRTLAEIVGNDDRFSTLESALIRTGLDVTLDDRGADFTVFAPTNDAFDDLGVDLSTIATDDLRNILLYHVVGAELQSDDISEGLTNVTSANVTGPGGSQLSLLVRKTGNSITVNGDRNVISADIEGVNGVIHGIDKVLAQPTVVDLAIAADELTSLVGALQTASGDLVDVLNGDGPFTVFAPVNSAFAAIQSTVDGLDADQLSNILLYHVVSGANVRAESLSSGAVTTANSGSVDVTVNADGSVDLTDGSGATVNVVATNIQGTNGVVHLIDAVLLPGS